MVGSFRSKWRGLPVLRLAPCLPRCGSKSRIDTRQEKVGTLLCCRYLKVTDYEEEACVRAAVSACEAGKAGLQSRLSSEDSRIGSGRKGRSWPKRRKRACRTWNIVMTRVRCGRICRRVRWKLARSLSAANGGSRKVSLAFSIAGAKILIYVAH